LNKEISIEIQLDDEYLKLVREIKSYIASARVKAALALNKEVIRMYWQLGQYLAEKRKTTNWGDKLLDQVSKDLNHAFPEMTGFSKTNLKYMRLFALQYPKGIGQQLVDQLPWGHLTLLIRLKENEERNWYLEQSLENGWSRLMLEKQIKTSLYKRQGNADDKITNYLTHLLVLRKSL
jgi:predicted nuclease of restriction endonuclease-like (RecB) superfamily